MSEASNRAVIDNAFDRFRKRKDTIVQAGIVKLAEAGLEYLLEAHDLEPQAHHHPEEENTMAYAVAHDGQIVASGCHHGGISPDFPGEAEQKARDLVSGKSGWTVLIISDMLGWYVWDWEWMFLEVTMEDIKTHFHDFFKPIA
jgi:hypothetical protein